MKLKFLLYGLVVLIVTFLSAHLLGRQLDTPTLEQRWEKVEQAKENGLPKTAIKHLEEILDLSLKAGDYTDWIKALTKKIKFETEIHGNRPRESITRLKKEIKKAPDETKPLLKSVLAGWYWNFFLSNRWQLQNRTQTKDLDEEDITTWDLNKILDEIDRLYTEILKEKSALSKIPAEEFKSFLKPGNSSVLLRPTLYDFLVFEAINFYTRAQNYRVKPEGSFRINFNSGASGNIKEFLNYKPQTQYRDSFKYKTIRLYQELLKLHRREKNREALADTQLNRMLFVKNNSYGIDKKEIFLKRLDEILKISESDHVNTAVYYRKAKTTGEKDNLVKALEYARKGFHLNPNTPGGESCKAYAKEITARKYDIRTQQLIPDGKRGQLQINYKNIDHMHIKVVPGKWETFSENLYPYSKDLEQLKEIVKREAAVSWSVDLKKTPDYKETEHIAPMPVIKPGFYRIFASPDKDFFRFAYSRFWVSSLGIVRRSFDEKINGFLVDNITGEPVPDAGIKAYAYKSGSGYRVYKNITTDSVGYFNFSTDMRHYYNYFLHARNGEDQLLDTSRIRGSYRYSEPAETEKVILITDRSLYRPGQNIYFKGILARINQAQDNYKVIPNRNIKVRFSDANGQKVETAEFETNDFGSFSGNFTAPSDGLTGRMSIQVVGPDGQTNFRVEEYKRPKFEVNFEVPEDEIKVEEKITIPGKAKSYSGAPVNNARVTYRVKREARFPFHRWWFLPPPPSPTTEIAHGTVYTDNRGNFKIEFKAVPDKSISKEDDPVFNYSITASVTDNTGETRTGNFNVKAGYTGLKLNTEIPDNIREDEESKIKISGETINGKKVFARGRLNIFKLKQPDRPIPPNTKTGFLMDIPEGFDENWQSWPKEAKILSKNFKSSPEASAEFKLDNLEAGLYRLKAQSKDKFGTETENMRTFKVLPPRDATSFPLKIPSHIDVKNRTLLPGEKLDVVWGTGYPSGRAFFEIEHKGEFLKRVQSPEGNTQHRFTFPVSEKLRGGFNLMVTYIRDNRSYSRTIPIKVPHSNKELDINFSTFRDRLKPGQKEKWTVNIKDKDGPLSESEFAAVLYDSSLDAFYPHQWSSFNFFSRYTNRISQNFSNRPVRFNGNSGDRYPPHPKERTYWSFPDFINIRMRYYGGRRMMLAENSGRVEAKREKSSRTRKDEAAEKKTESKKPEPEDSDFEDMDIRENLDETAFFYPHLKPEKDGSLTFEFTMPEALTKWKFMGLAHGKKLENGILKDYTVTQKDLMVEPNPPRFFREGDTVEFTAKISNLTPEKMNTIARLDFEDYITGKNVNEKISLKDSQKSITLNSKLSKTVSWKVKIPRGMGPLRYTVKARSKNFSDGQAGLIPVVPSRIFITESLPLWITGPGEKKFNFQKLNKLQESSTLEPVGFTLQMASNPSWYAIQALPYLMEFPHQCSEQVFNRYYANFLGSHIANSNPKIRKIFNQWKENNPDQLTGKLEQNEDLKNTLLKETPWVKEAQDETSQKHRLGMLFDKNNLSDNLNRALEELKDQQKDNGSWPWFPGGRGNEFITRYIVTGFGRLKHLKVKPETPEFVLKAVDYMDQKIREQYKNIDDLDENNLSHPVAQYLYARSFFLDVKPIPSSVRPAVDYYLDQAVEHWLSLDSRMSQGYLALALGRFDDDITSQKIMDSLLERSLFDPEMGRYWDDNRSSRWWYRAPIETQALMIEAFAEITKNTEIVDECRRWLLKQKQTQNWKTTKATSDAVYALILEGTDYLSSNEIVEVKLGGNKVIPDNIVPGPNYYRKKYFPAQITGEFSDITVIKKEKGPAWGGAYFQYFQDISEVESNATSLSVEKSLWIEKNTSKGPTLEKMKDTVKVGDRLMMRIVLKTDRDLEYVHLKDNRGSGTEPENVLSGYKYQDGLGYYQATGDVSTDFFISYLPKGTYVFEYPVRIQHRGKYQSGIARLQCMYAPEFSAHSESVPIKAK
ncbi:MAG: alpha-2-macroglobulin family protein [Elusimicrobiota bacterium]